MDFNKIVWNSAKKSGEFKRKVNNSMKKMNFE